MVDVSKWSDYTNKNPGSEMQGMQEKESIKCEG